MVSLCAVSVTLLLAAVYFHTQAKDEKRDILHQRKCINDVTQATLEGFYGYSDLEPFQRVAKKSAKDRHQRFHASSRSFATFFFVAAGFLLLTIFTGIFVTLPS